MNDKPNLCPYKTRNKKNCLFSFKTQILDNINN